MILKRWNIKPKISPQNIDETIPEKIKSYAGIAKKLAKLKAVSCSVSHPGYVVVAADTIVVIDGKVLGKPQSMADATAMLQRLSGREHRVYTGVAIYRDSILLSVFHEVTRVRFRKLELKEIREYVRSGSPMDKAGAYGIQDDFSISFAEKIYGDYFNVVGLPVSHTYLELRKILGR